MFRCASMATALALLAAVPSVTTAQVPSRPFPAHALRGELQVTLPPEVLLNGTAARLSPGARIRGQDNLLQMSAALVNQPLRVNYTLDGMGHVHLVWILTDAEASREPWPRTAAQAAAWRFDASTQTWTRP